MRRQFRTPLARYGFSGLAVFAAANGLWAPALVCSLIAAYAWRSHHR
jgi:pyruvate/2-oxoglutarate/acetoin dehydrogenase E1 component